MWNCHSGNFAVVGSNAIPPYMPGLLDKPPLYVPRKGEASGNFLIFEDMPNTGGFTPTRVDNFQRKKRFRLI